MRPSKEFQRQVLASLPVLFNEFIAGIGYGWIAPTLRQLQDNPTSELSFTSQQSSWVASLHEFGRLFGPLIAPRLLSLIGRRGSLATASISLFISFALIASTKSVAIIYLARMIFGIAVGLQDSTSTIYLCENMKPTIRGAVGSVSMASFYAGSLLEFCLGNYLTYDTTAYTNTTLSFLTLATIFVSIESADYLITKERYERALKNFLWLRGKNVTDVSMNAIAEFEVLKRHIEDERNKEKRTMIALLRTPIYRKSIAIVVAFCVLTNATGFDPVTSYVSIAFTEGVFTPNEYTMLFGALQFLAAIIGTIVIEKVNRRALLMVTVLIAAIANAATAVLLYLQNRTTVIVPYFPWWIFATITIYSMAFSSGMLPIFATVRGELLPPNVRSFGSAVSVIGHSLVGFLTTKVFLLVAEAVGMYSNFVFYSFMSVMCAFFTYFVLPETRGKSLIEIQNGM